MTREQATERHSSLRSLNPERVLDLVESALGVQLTNLCRPYNSYINRVFELETRDRTGLVAKFYRPGRWSSAALEEEHDFLRELHQEEIPVIAPLPLADGTTLGRFQDLYFTVFPRKGGRGVDELKEEEWVAIGQLLGRVHMIGARRQSRARVRMHPGESTAGQVRFLLESGLIPEELRAEYQRIAQRLIADIEPLFAGRELIRIHGDCHRGNIIHRPGESFFLIDFDDMATGPAVHDLWMLLPGPLEESFVEMELLLEGYETFHPFSRADLRLIEPLRAMRFIHYAAWCGRQVIEDGATEVIPDFGSPHYWRSEIDELADQLNRIREGAESSDHRDGSW